MRKIDFELTVPFKKDLTNIELFGICFMLDNLDEDEMIVGMPETCLAYGLAYTSTSGYAMYNVTEEIAIDVDENDLGIMISHFAITENNMLIVVAYDDDECAHLYEIEHSDLIL